MLTRLNENIDKEQTNFVTFQDLTKTFGTVYQNILDKQQSGIETVLILLKVMFTLGHKM